MSRTVKIAISLPEELLEAAERGRQATGETRSEFFRRAVQTVLRRQEQQVLIDRYIQGYREHPESDEEVAEAEQTSFAGLAQEPWE